MSPSENPNPLTSMIDLADDRLAFTFPEIARQLRAHVERRIGHILTGAQRRIEKMSS